jgi:hypothetical protein
VRRRRWSAGWILATRGRGCDRPVERPAATILDRASMAVVWSRSLTSRLHRVSSDPRGMRLCSLHRSSLVCASARLAIEGKQIAAGRQCPSTDGANAPGGLLRSGTRAQVAYICDLQAPDRHVSAALCVAIIDVDLKIHVLMASGNLVHFGSALASSLLRFLRC